MSEANKEEIPDEVKTIQVDDEKEDKKESVEKPKADATEKKNESAE